MSFFNVFYFHVHHQDLIGNSWYLGKNSDNEIKPMDDSIMIFPRKQDQTYTYFLLFILG